jgi:hypothetical protein
MSAAFYDLFEIEASGALYIRMVATAIDPNNMYRILPVDDNDDIPPIAWPKEVQLSPVPDWPKTVAPLQKRLADDEQRKKAQSNEDTDILERIRKGRR